MAFRRSFSSILVAFLVLVAVLLISGLVVSIGVRLAGDIDQFQEAMTSAGGWLLLWRLLLYAGLAAYWWGSARARVLARILETAESPVESRSRLQRLERMVIVMLVVFEALNLLRWLGGA